MKQSKESRQFLEKSTLRYAGHLDEAAGWLEGRGLDLEVARGQGLGVVRDPLAGHGQFEGRLCIPYLTDAGPVNATFRCIKDHDCKSIDNHSKYLFRKNSGTHMYGVQDLSWADEWIAVTEGELDALTLKQIGVPAVGISGAKKWQDHWSNVFEDFSRVYLFEDGDSAGEELWERLSNEVHGAIRVRMPDGEDVNSMYNKQGKDYLLGRFKK